MKRNRFAVMIATLMLLTGCGTGTDKGNHNQDGPTLINHPRTYPDGYMTEDLKYMDDWQTRNHRVILDTLENFGTALIQTNYTRIHQYYFSDYPDFYVEGRQGTIANTPESMEQIGKYMFTKEVIVYAVTGKKHTCVYSLYYLFIANKYNQKINESEIKYASVTATRNNCLSYDYSR